MRLRMTVAAVLVAVGVGGCGGSHHAATTTATTTASATTAAPGERKFTLTQARQECPAAADPHKAHPGVCAPQPVLQQLQQGSAPSSGLKLSNYPTYPDVSNNVPVTDVSGVARAGHPGVIDKANQGNGFIDYTATPTCQSARAHHIACGLYDFVQEYSVAEANTFIGVLHRAGIYRNSRNTFPPTLDVEYGAFYYPGLQAMINTLWNAYGRVNIYTGCWYWTPHAGYRWPAHVTAWISGYPSASPCPGMPNGTYTQHQYADNGCITFQCTVRGDMNVYLGGAGQFRAFVHATATPKPKPKPKPRPHHPTPAERAHLYRLYGERTAIRRHLINSGCRVRRPRHACAPLYARGRAVNAEILVLHKRHVY